MCTINRKTRRKTATIYKAVIKHNNEYYAPFSGMPIEIGVVKLFTIKQYNVVRGTTNLPFTYYEIYEKLYNALAVGKVSGFSRLKDAKRLLNVSSRINTILSIQIKGEIWEGDSSKITNYIPRNLLTLFGTEIISFKEIKL